jgi:hypothetical protein
MQVKPVRLGDKAAIFVISPQSIVSVQIVQ